MNEKVIYRGDPFFITYIFIGKKHNNTTHITNTHQAKFKYNKQKEIKINGETTAHNNKNIHTFTSHNHNIYKSFFLIVHSF